ncbi:flavin reductase family protein [Actinomycetospora sp. OC33-EN08]|uniref:Flavin reductase family protein n=1 Tax=Actinomycetospora aurantiaca TaxID=3129233 RepID=A0ABU8MPJ5_9PSEU
MPLDAAGLRTAFSARPEGLVALAADVGGLREGMAASTFTPASLDPPLVSVCVARSSRTWPRLRASRGLGVSVLAEEHEQVARRLSARDGDRFAGTAVTTRSSGAVLIDGACAWFECAIEDELDAGDHLIALLAVLEVHHLPDARPLVFHRSSFTQLASPCPAPAPVAGLVGAADGHAGPPRDTGPARH